MYFKRMLNVKLMDFELTLLLMHYSLTSPNKLYQYTKWHKQIKNQWGRDDPCFLFCMIHIIIIVGIAYSVYFIR